MAEREPPHHRMNMLELGAIAGEELAPGRGVIKQIRHLHPATDRQCHRRDLARLTARAVDLIAAFLPFGAGGQSQSADRRDARQRFAAKAHAGQLA